ncbi:MAG TPA: DUF3800 domain-containing protein [Conexibacter sp.]|nr:DUF3800 domain-containing protein [Conexibacter sp.]
MVLFYVDDSGDERLTTFSAIGVPVEQWNAALARWLAWRRKLHFQHDIPIDYRLHANEWVAGRGRPAKDPHATVNRSKPTRWQIYLSALEVLAEIPSLSVLTVAGPGPDRAAAYRQLMLRIERFLSVQREHGLIVVDGESPELMLMHRELDLESRLIVEDPWKRNARESQWLQAADLVAYAAYQHIARRASRGFMWHWYEQCLGDRVIGENAEGPPEDGPSETLSKTEYVAGADDSTKHLPG